MYNLTRKPTHPGEILKEEFLAPIGLSQAKLAAELGVSLKIINELVNEKRSISTELALKLARYWGTSAELWLNLQNQFDLYVTFKDKSSEIKKIHPFKITA